MAKFKGHWYNSYHFKDCTSFKKLIKYEGTFQILNFEVLGLVLKKWRYMLYSVYSHLLLVHILLSGGKFSNDMLFWSALKRCQERRISMLRKTSFAEPHDLSGQGWCTNFKVKSFLNLLSHYAIVFISKVSRGAHI